MQDMRPSWLKREDWRAGVVKSTAADKTSFGDAYGAVFYLGFLIWLYYTNALLAVLATVVAVVVVVLRQTRKQERRTRFGVSEFRFDRVPFVVGSKVSGTVIVRSHISGGMTELVLRYVTSNDDDPGWSSTSSLMSHHLQHEDGKTLIPVTFELPDHLPHTRHAILADTVSWWLFVTHARTDFRAAFELPVGPAGVVVEDTAHVRAAKRRLKEQLSVFDDPASGESL